MHLHSFWWRVIKKAYQSAKRPFESVGVACAIFAGLVAIGFLFHLFTQELGDYMIYWSIALPVIVLVVWFLWNLVKSPHLIREQDLAEVISGKSQIPSKKSISPQIAGLIFIALIVSAFMGLLAIKNHQISQLKSHPVTVTNNLGNALPQTASESGGLDGIDDSGWTQPEVELHSLAYYAGQRAHRRQEEKDWPGFADAVGKSYVYYFQLATNQPICWDKVCNAAAFLAQAYHNLPGKGDDEKLADNSSEALEGLLLDKKIPNISNPAMQPVAVLYNKLSALIGGPTDTNGNPIPSSSTNQISATAGPVVNGANAGIVSTISGGNNQVGGSGNTQIMVQQPDFIEGTDFTHKQLDHIFPFGYAVIYLNSEGEKETHEFHNNLLNWKIDWDQVKIEPHFGSGMVTFTIPDMFANGGTGNHVEGTTDVFTMPMKRGLVKPAGIGFGGDPAPYVAILSDNQRSPIFAIGFRIPSVKETPPDAH
jgi:hypothetical protein